MNSTIFLFLFQDGITNGAIYALLGLALVLVFAVTRVILIPQGDFVTFGALTYAALTTGKMPGTVELVVLMGVAAFALRFVCRCAARCTGRVARAFALYVALPCIVLGAIVLAASHRGLARRRAAHARHRRVARALPLSHRLPADGADLGADAADRLGRRAPGAARLSLIVFGAEGHRGPPLADARSRLGPLRFTGQSLACMS